MGINIAKNVRYKSSLAKTFFNGIPLNLKFIEIVLNNVNMAPSMINSLTTIFLIPRKLDIS